MLLAPDVNCLEVEHFHGEVEPKSRAGYVMDLQSTFMMTIARRASLGGVVIFVVAAAMLFVQPTDFGWWPTRLFGLAALLLATAAIVLRPASAGRDRHWLIGWMACAALVAHIAAVGGFQPVFWRWLTPAIPIEIVAALVAASAFAFALAIQRRTRLRRALGPLLSQHAHRIAGYALVATACAHIVLIAGTSFTVALLFLSGLALVLAESLARERHVAWLVLLLAVFVAALVGLAGGPLAAPRLSALRQAPIDHAGFLHTDHVGFTCTGCHHNFIDRTGSENCMVCHKRISVSEASRIDRMFHAFCSDCHRTEKRKGEKSGPIDDCKGCHDHVATAGARQVAMRAFAAANSALSP